MDLADAYRKGYKHGYAIGYNDGRLELVKEIKDKVYNFESLVEFMNKNQITIKTECDM